MRPVSPLALGDGEAELSTLVRARAVSADLGTGATRQLAARGLRRSDGASDGYTAHQKRGAKRDDGWACRGAKHGLRSPCENCTVQVSPTYPRSVPTREKRRLYLPRRSSLGRRVASRTKVRHNIPNAARACGADSRASGHGGKRKGRFWAAIGRSGQRFRPQSRHAMRQPRSFIVPY